MGGKRDEREIYAEIEGQRNLVDTKVKDEALKIQMAKMAKMKQQKEAVEKEKRDLAAREYWAKVEKAAEDLLSRGMEGYNDWITAMMNMANALRNLSRALATTIDNRLNVIKGIRDTLGLDESRKPWVQAVTHPIDTIMSQWGPKNLDAPVIINTTVKENGALDVQTYFKGERLDKPTVPGKEKTSPEYACKVGVVAWLRIKGYQYDKATGAFVNAKTNAPLTQETFDSLRSDNSLNEFLSGRFTTKVDLRTGPAPTPTPSV